IGERTRLPSLELGCEPGATGANCDSGYSCVYSSTISWRSAVQPLPKEVNPRVVFERLFGSAPGAGGRGGGRPGSLLGLVREDSRDLAGRLGAGDRRKLDEYLASVRDVERRIQRAEQMPPAPAPDYKAPAGVPAGYDEHVRVLYDLIALAFQADVTRVVTC